MSKIPEALQYNPSLNVKDRQALTCTRLVRNCKEIPYCDECILHFDNIEDFIKWEKEHV